jgi:hypothetical protein
LTPNLEGSYNDEKEATSTQNTGIKQAHLENFSPHTGKQDTILQNGTQTGLDIWN